MSKLNIDQKTVKELFSGKKTNFLIPDYQRPYAWGETECMTLWEDLFLFSFPNNDYEDFDSDSDEYFLGPIVTFKNDNGQMEIIDGQQRLTTLMLLLRAFYDRYGNMRDDKALKTSRSIEQCIWKTDEFGDADKSILKIDSEVASDEDKEEFLNILRTGIVSDKEDSTYANNYRFFQKKIEEFLNMYPDWFSFLPIRIMNNCILLPIEAESQDTALRIFSTLNDRGKPLSDADIFKAQFYKYYSDKGEKDSFMEDWKDLEMLCNKIFPASTGSALDEIFTRYMYYERARKGIRASTTEALRKFYEKDGYALLKNDETFDNLIDLAQFWKDILQQNKERFSERVLKRLYVLNYAPNGMWTYFVSVYYMSYREDGGALNDEHFYQFLNKITAFIWAYAITNPGVNTLRTPVYPEMINLVNKDPVDFNEFLFNEAKVNNLFRNYDFSNYRKITKSMLTWWAFQDPEQPLLLLNDKMDIEHIYAKRRQEKDHTLSDPKNIESLGNKSLLEKGINISASDYRFDDKRKYYLGGYTTRRNQVKEGTKIKELRDLATNAADFIEDDIINRHDEIISSFIEFMGYNGLLINE
ncbi:DUF262 domain-containing protein [Methanobrevibacter sp.]|uniref:DUF262 domain-containing protein n=2 Tax=Methanobrevibacter sp. TaxID=66852 RepID=UPI00386B0E85